MFTGIVEGKGKILKVENLGLERRLTIEFPHHLTEVQLGDSISINGVCLTISEKRAQAVRFDLSEETVKKSTLSQLKEGDFVNLERALRLNGRLGGHFVTGHIDGTGVITGKSLARGFTHLKVEVPEAVTKYIIPKGSIAIDGVSLTVNECKGKEILMTLIPYTLERTTLLDKKTGDRVNMEADILGKYVTHLLKQGGGRSQRLDRSFLEEHGYLEGDEGSDG